MPVPQQYAYQQKAKVKPGPKINVPSKIKSSGEPEQAAKALEAGCSGEFSKIIWMIKSDMPTDK